MIEDLFEQLNKDSYSARPEEYQKGYFFYERSRQSSSKNETKSNSDVNSLDIRNVGYKLDFSIKDENKMNLGEVETKRKIIQENAKKNILEIDISEIVTVVTDVKVIDEEKRVTNGIKILEKTLKKLKVEEEDEQGNKKQNAASNAKKLEEPIKLEKIVEEAKKKLKESLEIVFNEINKAYNSATSFECFPKNKEERINSMNKILFFDINYDETNPCKRIMNVIKLSLLNLYINLKTRSKFNKILLVDVNKKKEISYIQNSTIDNLR